VLKWELQQEQWNVPISFVSFVKVASAIEKAQTNRVVTENYQLLNIAATRGAELISEMTGAFPKNRTRLGSSSIKKVDPFDDSARAFLRERQRCPL
jgi:hypothetical protein